jgi:hypothetical protein
MLASTTVLVRHQQSDLFSSADADGHDVELASTFNETGHAAGAVDRQ